MHVHPLQPMLEAHPSHTEMARLLNLAATVHALVDCAQVTISCADACLSEHRVGDLRRCVRLCADGASICTATASVLSRSSAPDWGVIRALVTTCALACEA